MDSNKTHAQDEQGITPEKFEEINKALEIHGVHGMTRATLVWLSSVLDKKLRAPAPAQLLGDVVETMCDTVVRLRARLSLKELTGSITMTAEQLRESMTAAALVLLERAYADVGFDDEEWRKACTFFPEQQLYALTHAGLHHFFKLRRASLLKPAPPTLEEDVTKAVYSVTGTSKPWLEHDMVAAIMEALARRSSGSTHD